MRRPPSTLAALQRRAARDEREHARDMAASGGNLAAWHLLMCMEGGERLSAEAAAAARAALMTGATATPRGVQMHPEAVRAFVGQPLGYIEDRRRGCGASAFEGVSAAAATLAKRPARAERDVHAAIAEAAAELRGGTPGWMREASEFPEVAALLNAARDAVAAGVPRFVHFRGRNYWLRCRLAMGFDVFAAPGDKEPLLVGASFSTESHGHKPGH